MHKGDKTKQGARVVGELQKAYDERQLVSCTSSCEASEEKERLSDCRESVALGGLRSASMRGGREIHPAQRVGVETVKVSKKS